ncbi:MAG: STAS-like domain-containing protein [Bdellovibrionales bacterium]
MPKYSGKQMNKTISITNDFSRYPYGRYRKHSKASGEAFREDLLIPALQENKSVTVDLDGTEGFGSSFLDEAFANLLRLEQFDKEFLKNNLHFKSEEDPSLIDEIMEYIDKAAD